MSAPPAGISIREFARREGCDDKLVRRAIGRSALPVLSDGTLDPALIGSGWRKANRRADKSADTSADTGADTAPSVRTDEPVSAPVSAPDEVVVTLEPQPHGGALKRSAAQLEELAEELANAVDEDFIADMLAGRFASHGQAERIKENALAFKHLLAARRAAGALVEIDTAEAVLFETFRASRDAWLNWPTRVAPLLAADLGLEADRVTEVLTLHVHQHLAELGEPEADFAESDQAG